MSLIEKLYRWWWRDAPRFARRFYWRMVLLALPVPVLIALSLLTDYVPRTMLTLTALYIVVGVFLILWVVAFGRWETRLMRRLRTADYRLCPQCGFELTGHEGRFNCPECGTGCDVDEVQAAWRGFRPRIGGGNV